MQLVISREKYVKHAMTSNLRDRKNQAQDEQISVPYADNIGFKQNVNV